METLPGLIVLAILYLTILVLLAIIICFVLDRINDWWWARLDKKGTPTTHEVWEARLRSPQFAVLEAHYGGPVPDSLKRLYENPDLLRQTDFEFVDPRDPEDGDPIAEFLPADRKAIDEIAWDIGEANFPFAEDHFGNYYYVSIGAAPQDPCPVYFYDHDGGGTEKIADSLDEFLVRPIRRLDPAQE